MEISSISQRLQILETVKKAGRGHIGPAFSLVEIFRYLYERKVDIGAIRSQNEYRDRVVLSKGHGCLALYCQLSSVGILDPALLKTFCQFDSHLGGHPERNLPLGIEASTGSLGHGLSLAVGMAKAIQIKKSSCRVYCILGDGECNEGSVWEAALAAAKHKLSNLWIIVDRNGLQSYGSTEIVCPMGDLANKWKAFGFWVSQADGHNLDSIDEGFRQLETSTSSSPKVLICKTVKGCGVSRMENNPDWHHTNKLLESDYRDMVHELNKFR